MARWTDLAAWRGPTENQGGPMKEVRGVVLHIAEGYYEGTISYQRNPDVNVSSHFIVGDGAKSQGRDGDVAQIVDTDVTAWTQSAGNGHWLSAECAGFTPNALTAAQVESCARLLARAHQVYRFPLQIAINPNGYGLGHHSMGCNWPGGAWGHCDCPGDAIIAQKAQILSRAKQIVGGSDVALRDDPDGKWLFPRVESLKTMKPIAEGPEKGQEMGIVVQVKQIAADVAAFNARPPVQSAPVDAATIKAVLLDPAVLAAIAKAVNDDGHRRSAD